MSEYFSPLWGGIFCLIVAAVLFRNERSTFAWVAVVIVIVTIWRMLEGTELALATDVTFWALVVAQVLNLLVYRWVGRVIAQPRGNHPIIFHNPVARLTLICGPWVIAIVLIILAFVLTDSPWWFLAGSVALLIAWSSIPNPEALR